MPSRTNRSTVVFTTPFNLSGFEERQAAGQYLVDCDEELIDGISRLARGRTGTCMHLPAIGQQSLRQQIAQVDADELEVALHQDRDQHEIIMRAAGGVPAATI